MEIVVELLQQYGAMVELGLIAVFFICFIMFLVCHCRMKKQLNYYEKLFKKGDTNLEDLMMIFTGKCEETIKDVAELEERLANLKKQTNNCVQKINICRFNAVPDVGGEMSFSLTILDEHNSGVIISNFYGRTESHVYLRKVTNGRPDVENISPEEKESLKGALNQ